MNNIIQGVNYTSQGFCATGTSIPFRMDYKGRMVVSNTLYLTSLATVGQSQELAISTPAINTSAIISIPNTGMFDTRTSVVQLNRLTANIASTSAGGTVNPVTISLTFDRVLRSTGATIQTTTLFSIKAGIGASSTYTYEWTQPIMLYSDTSTITRNIVFTVSAGGANVYSSAQALFVYQDC